MRLIITICVLLGSTYGRCQSTYLWAEVNPGWKVKASEYWKNAKGYGKKLPERMASLISSNDAFLNNEFRLQLEKKFQDKGILGVILTDDPEGIVPQPDDLYVDWTIELREITQVYPYFKKELVRHEPSAIISMRIVDGTGRIRIDTAIISSIDYKTRVKPRLTANFNEYELVADEYKVICQETFLQTIEGVLLVLDRVNHSRPDKAKVAANSDRFKSQVSFLFKARKNKYPGHYTKSTVSAPALPVTREVAAVSPESETRAAYGDAAIAVELSAALSNAKYYSLFIAVNNYKDPGINDLDNPANDAKRLYELLTQEYTFKPELAKFLTDPTQHQIIESLDELSQKLTSADNLLIFYAGHGLFDQQLGNGYWLPSDATPKNRANWLSNSLLRDYIRGIPAKHTLLIADACFSGGIFKVRDAFAGIAQSEYELYKLPSRKAMTSGAMKTVPDKSVFLDYLTKRLRENTKPFLSSEVLFANFKSAVINNSPNHQVPQFGEIHETGDEGGDFIFIRKQK